MNSYYFSQENNTYENTNIKPLNGLNSILILYSDIKSITDLNYKNLDENKLKLNKKN